MFAYIKGVLIQNCKIFSFINLNEPSSINYNITPVFSSKRILIIKNKQSIIINIIIIFEFGLR